MDEQPIGRRVAHWRNRRGMSQQVFADRLGKSKSWVDKIERGVRRLDKFSMVYQIAEVLSLDVQVLLGRDLERRVGIGAGIVGGIEQRQVEEIRRALERYDGIAALFPGGVEVPQLDVLRKAVDHAWMTYQHARYDGLSRALPRLLHDAQAADCAYSATPHGPAAAHLLGQVYQIVSSALRKLGEHELSWLAADRSIAVAQRADDPLLAGSAAVRVGSALLAMGRPWSALEVNVSMANRLAPGCGGEPATPQRLSVYGMLLLQGAMAAARIGDSATVRDLLAAADEAAAGVGENANHYWSSFGPTNVKLHRAAAAVELGEGQAAVDTHESIDPGCFLALLPERRAHHYIDIARGLTQVGDAERAGEMLLEGDRLAPSEIRFRPVAHEVLAHVLRHSRGTPSGPVAELAEAMGVGG